MRADAGMGTESIGSDDISVPRIKLMQGTSPELETFDGLKTGDFWHTAAEFNLGPKFLAVPVYRDKRYILWRPQDSGGGILARADDGRHWVPPHASFEVTLNKIDGGKKVTWDTAPTVEDSGLAQWGTLDPDNASSPPAATLMYNFVLIFPQHPELLPAVLTFQRSTIGVARKFQSTLKTRNRPIFGQVYEFSSVNTTNREGKSFKTLIPRANGLLADQSLYNQYKEMYDQFLKAAPQIRDLEGLQQEESDEDVGGEDAGKRPAY
jgi:hypothetical protein